LQRKTYTFELISPDGDVLEVDIKAPTSDEVLELQYSNPRPEPLVTDFRKEDGRVYPVYGYEDAGYQRKLAEWLARSKQLLIIQCLPDDFLPGETEEEKLEALKNVEAWARVGLYQAIEMLVGVAEDRVKLRSFRAD